jgi:hypothetical protein
MARGDKLLRKMRQNPLDWRIDQVQTLCAAFDITCQKPTRGDHYGVSHQSQVHILTVPAHRPIKPKYIRDLVEFVDRVIAAQGSE